MKKNNFNLLKESKDTSYRKNPSTGKFDIPNIIWGKTYKEEIDIWITTNKYNNIDEIYIFPKNDDNRRKLLDIFKFGNWEYLYDKKDIIETNIYYKSLLAD